MTQTDPQRQDRRQAVPIIASIFLVSLWFGDRAEAGHDIFHIFTPMVEEGHWSLEAITGFHSGFPAADDDDRHHGQVRAASELALLYAPTDFWMTKIAVEFERDLDGTTEPVALASENVLRLDGWTPHFIDVGWFTSLSAALSDEATHVVEFGPVVTLSAGRAALTLNPFLEQTFGQNREEGTGFVYAYRATYGFTDTFSVGLEGYGQIENIADGPPIDEQVHRVGPVLYFGPVHGLSREPHDHGDHVSATHGVHGQDHGHWHAEVGVLFGLTPHTPDVALKFNAGLDF